MMSTDGAGSMTDAVATRRERAVGRSLATHLAELRPYWPLAAIVLVALLARTALLFSIVFAADGVNYQDSDAWYHMRLIDNVVRNFPHRAMVDPFLTNAPEVGMPVLFDVFVGGIAWLIGLGAPSSRTVEVVGAILPPILGALTAIPVCFIAARLFDRRAGLLAAALLAIAPGQLLTRSVLGFTDHHVAEALLTALTILAMVTALGTGEPRRRLRQALLAGVALSAYLLTWIGGALLVFVLCAWGVAQYVLDDLHRTVDDQVAPVMLPALAVALLALLILQDHTLWRYPIQLTSVGAALVTVAGLGVIRRGLRAVRAPRGALAGCLLVAALGGAALFALVAPEVTARIVADAQRLRPDSTFTTISEARPLLTMTGAMSLAAPYGVFGPPFFIGLVALAWLAWRAGRSGQPALTLLVTWSALMYAATLGQNRFGYYLAVNLAVLTGWACSAVLAWAWAPRRGARSRADARRARRRADAEALRPVL